MKRLTLIIIACLCAAIALPPAFAGEAKKAPDSKAAPTKAAAPAMKYKEAPELAELVKAGKLPPVEKRLPENPLVVPADEIGQYGGVWRRGFLGPSDFNGVNRVIYDVLVRFGPDGATIEMKLAESVTPSADFKTWTVKLRKGIKWSDGSPFTADDIMFWYKDVLLNKDLVPAMPAWMLNKDGSRSQVQKIDDLTRHAGPSRSPTPTSCSSSPPRTTATGSIPIFLPSKYLKQFHASTPRRKTWTRWWRTPSSRPGSSCSPTSRAPSTTPSGRAWPPGSPRTASATRSSS